jgi:hypothetical protein
MGDKARSHHGPLDDHEGQPAELVGGGVDGDGGVADEAFGVCPAIAFGDTVSQRPLLRRSDAYRAEGGGVMRSGGLGGSWCRAAQKGWSGQRRSAV